MGAPLALAAEAFRAKFPALASGCYLASCSFGARAGHLEQAMDRMLRAMHHPGTPWAAYEEEEQALRRRAAAFFGVRATQLALLPNLSAAAFQVASTRRYAERPKIVTTDLEFPSVAHVWLAQQARGADVEYVTGSDPAQWLDGYLAAIDERTALVSVPLVSYRNGARLPVEAIAERAHAAGALVFVDAYQAAGTMPVMPAALGCDYLATGTYKYLLGLPGLAFLYARDAQQGDAPQLTGWFGRVDPFAFDPYRLDFAAGAQRYETGTPAVPALYAANAALALFESVAMEDVARHVGALVQAAHARLTAAGETVWTPAAPAAQGPMVAIADSHAERLAAWLLERGVAVSPRGACIRAAFHFYNSRADVDTLCEALGQYRRQFGLPAQGLSHA
jgi:selenocysteine lyase/cysteine desulfurase